MLFSSGCLPVAIDRVCGVCGCGCSDSELNWNVGSEEGVLVMLGTLGACRGTSMTSAISSSIPMAGLSVARIHISNCALPCDPPMRSG